MKEAMNQENQMKGEKGRKEINIMRREEKKKGNIWE